MKNWLTAATKRRVIELLRSILTTHPRYENDAKNVQNKFSFQERPQRGIIVTNASASRVVLSAQNYIGRLNSFLMQFPVGTSPGTSLEWVRENQSLLEQFSRERNVFPSPPGVYILKITKLPDVARSIPGEFILDPILTVTNEPLIIFNSAVDTIGHLSRENLYPGSVRLWLDGRRPLLDGVDYEVNDTSGEVTFLKTTPIGEVVFADYRYVTDTQGPFYFKEEVFNTTALPGAVLAFGDRPRDCDQIAIVVTEDRTSVAELFGGKFEVNFDLTVFARDAEDREKMSDYVVVKVLEAQDSLGFEGLELLDISPTGESEEIYNAEIDDYYYDGSVSITFRVDWETQVPLPIQVFRFEGTSKEEEQSKGYLDGTYTLNQIIATADPTQLAGISLILGHDIGYSRVI